MANQQIFPQTTYPGSGDIQTTPGSPTTTVVGWQGVPVSPNSPLDGQVPVYEVAINQWVPSTFTQLDNDSLSVAGVAVSPDYWIFVARKDTEVQVNAAFAPNAYPVLVAGSPANTF
jgi:hypothetical protein